MNHDGFQLPGWKGFLSWVLGGVLSVLIACLIPKFKPVCQHFELIVGIVLMGRLADWIFQMLKKPWQIPKTALITFVIGGVVGLSSSYLLKSTPKTLLYISPAPYLSLWPFYADLVDELLRQGKDFGFEVVIRLPKDNFSPSDQKDLLDSAAKQRDRWTAVVFTPFIVIDQSSEDKTYFEFLSKMKDSNVILSDADLSVDLQSRLGSAGIGIPPCVGGDERAAGAMAAELLLKFLASKNISEPVIVAFDKPGHSTRSIAFQDYIRSHEKESNAHLLPSWPTERYYREEARKTAYDRLPSQRVNAVFPGNDAAALGVRDAIIQLHNEGKLSAKDPIWVMGYDGTHEVTQLLEKSKQDILVNSVKVRIGDQVHQILTSANDLIEDRRGTLRTPNAKPCQSLPPSPVLP